MLSVEVSLVETVGCNFYFSFGLNVRNIKKHEYGIIIASTLTGIKMSPSKKKAHTEHR